MAERIRVVIAWPGPDTDDGAAEASARALRDAGMEVVYTGPGQTPEQIVRTVVQEDPDALGLPGADPTLVERTRRLLEENGAGDVVLVVDEAGVDDIVPWLRAHVAPG